MARHNPRKIFQALSRNKINQCSPEKKTTLADEGKVQPKRRPFVGRSVSVTGWKRKSIILEREGNDPEAGSGVTARRAGAAGPRPQRKCSTHHCELSQLSVATVRPVLGKGPQGRYLSCFASGNGSRAARSATDTPAPHLCAAAKSRVFSGDVTRLSER